MPNLFVAGMVVLNMGAVLWAACTRSWNLMLYFLGALLISISLLKLR